MAQIPTDKEVRMKILEIFGELSIRPGKMLKEKTHIILRHCEHFRLGFSPEFLKLRMSADPAPILFF